MLIPVHIKTTLCKCHIRLDTVIKYTLFYRISQSFDLVTYSFKLIYHICTDSDFHYAFFFWRIAIRRILRFI